jgi:hypothetical protein
MAITETFPLLSSLKQMAEFNTSCTTTVSAKRFNCVTHPFLE